MSSLQHPRHFLHFTLNETFPLHGYMRRGSMLIADTKHKPMDLE